MSNFNLDDLPRGAQVNIKLELEHVKQAKHKQQYQILTWASEAHKRMKQNDACGLLLLCLYLLTTSPT
jgi:hypothetical protein